MPELAGKIIGMPTRKVIADYAEIPGQIAAASIQLDRLTRSGSEDGQHDPEVVREHTRSQ